ncbi:hypothetical protein AYO20_08429 [Fonsecaea nubica]|uniref:Uncharacterized protein n=1 Tax=Fonsecaea nubica TaxID=856822 RepID=A0A178CMQ3_9EURO|nr:hypothetical protein AYO20_08429 [Fonsecaea nubica]OAL31098.1 hypothetical protein AYO20_08429 [Fonsecaea nubica]
MAISRTYLIVLLASQILSGVSVSVILLVACTVDLEPKTSLLNLVASTTVLHFLHLFASVARTSENSLVGLRWYLLASWVISTPVNFGLWSISQKGAGFSLACQCICLFNAVLVHKLDFLWEHHHSALGGLLPLAVRIFRISVWAELLLFGLGVLILYECHGTAVIWGYPIITLVQYFVPLVVAWCCVRTKTTRTKAKLTAVSFCFGAWMTWSIVGLGLGFHFHWDVLFYSLFIPLVMAIPFSNGLGLFSHIGRLEKSRMSSEVTTTAGVSKVFPPNEDGKTGDGVQSREMRKLFKRLDEYKFDGRNGSVAAPEQVHVAPERINDPESSPVTVFYKEYPDEYAMSMISSADRNCSFSTISNTFGISRVNSATGLLEKYRKT